MSSFPREEVQAAIDGFAAANVRAEEERNWAPLADFYTDDAVYTYVGLTSGGAVEARGKAAIRKIVMGRDMEDYAGWTFPFQWVAIDGARVVTRWSNRAPERRADGSPVECPGMSVLEYAGDGKFKSQFDLYDRLSVKAVIDEAADIRKKHSKATKRRAPSAAKQGTPARKSKKAKTRKSQSGKARKAKGGKPKKAKAN